MMTKIEKALSLGKVVGAKKLLEEFYLAEDKRQWLATKQEEYDVLYPEFTIGEEVCESLLDMPNKYNELVKYYEIINTDEETYTITYKIPIDYSEDENYTSFTDWLNETRVVSEEVLATYDEDGIELTPYQPEVTELVRPYIANDVSQLVEDYISNHSGLKAKAKSEALDSLIVSANTVPFDADNQSINYMSSVVGLASFKMLQGMYNISDAKAIEELTEFDSLIISLYEATFKSRVEWENANNTISNVQLETVAEALEKGMQEVSNIIVGAN